ncbi:MAG TPA: hypothetical protein VK508_17050 [Cyclobacteriaceae bacterium]|nr:hypothetical protein [Cyclobacteriaceae bacterium]
MGKKGFHSVKGYYTRAKVFGYAMLLVAVAALILSLFPALFPA